MPATDERKPVTESGQEIGDQDPGGGRSQRRDGCGRRQHVERSIAPPAGRGVRGLWMPTDLEGALDEVDDPVVGHARARVEAGLVPTVELEARLPNLDH